MDRRRLSTATQNSEYDNKALGSDPEGNGGLDTWQMSHLVTQTPLASDKPHRTQYGSPVVIVIDNGAGLTLYWSGHFLCTKVLNYGRAISATNKIHLGLQDYFLSTKEVCQSDTELMKAVDKDDFKPVTKTTDNL